MLRGLEQTHHWASLWPLTWQKLTKFNKRIRPQRAADALPVVSDQKLFLQLIQEAESQNIWVVWGAHHQVSNTQRTGETGTHKHAQLSPNWCWQMKKTTLAIFQLILCKKHAPLQPLSHKIISMFNSTETFFSSAVIIDAADVDPIHLLHLYSSSNIWGESRSPWRCLNYCVHHKCQQSAQIDGVYHAATN